MSDTLRVGYAEQSITPEPGITLSGFAARCNRPSTGIDDPLAVHALVVEQDGERMLLLSFDLLGLGAELTTQLHAVLDAEPEIDVPPARRIFCCTHTHSAPATVTLLGCGIPEPAYWALVCRAVVAAVRDACRSTRPAVMRITRRAVPDASYNRRRLLADGRVVMTQFPAAEVVAIGPTLEQVLLVRFDDAQGRGIAGIAHWAAHPDTVCGTRVTADFPGELCRQLAAAHGVPFLYLQGACGDINPPFLHMTREEMLRNVAGLVDALAPAEWVTAESGPGKLIAWRLPLAYAPPFAPDELAAFHRGMAAVAETGNGPEATLAELANVLNVEPGQAPDPVMLRYFAGILRDWSAEQLASPPASAACELALHVLRMGTLVWCFVAAEPFAVTALTLQAANPYLTLAVVGYTSPLIGYLPTDAAMDEGGYEVEYAYRVYGHPAPFAHGSEARVRSALQGMIEAATQ